MLHKYAQLSNLCVILYNVCEFAKNPSVKMKTFGHVFIAHSSITIGMQIHRVIKTFIQIAVAFFRVITL